MDLSTPTDDKYLEIIKEEDFMRQNMYKEEYKNDGINANMYWNLVKITDKNIQPGDCKDKDLIMSKHSNRWKDLKEDLDGLKTYLREKFHFGAPDEDIVTEMVQKYARRKFPEMGKPKLNNIANLILNLGLKDWDNVFLAGGSIFCYLFGHHVRDYDLFIYGLNEFDAVEKVKSIIEEIGNKNSIPVRTRNCITFTNKRYNKVQIILRLYRTVSEIIHGFDVDSCCLGFDGKSYWGTKRAVYSITKGYNTVNFDRMSPSYEYRLMKYAIRGVPIKVPGFVRGNVLSTMDSDYRYETTRDKKPYYKICSEMRGLDILLALEYRFNRINYNQESGKGILRLGDENSDYEGTLNSEYQNKYTNAKSIAEFLSEKIDTHPEYSTTLNTIAENDDYSDVYVGLFLRQKQIKSFSGKDLDIPDDIWEAFGTVRPWDLPQKLGFKVTNPGEQMSSTFNRTVVKDHITWYNGKCYHDPVVERRKEYINQIRLLPIGYKKGFLGGIEVQKTKQEMQERDHIGD